VGLGDVGDYHLIALHGLGQVSVFLCKMETQMLIYLSRLLGRLGRSCVCQGPAWSPASNR
jgi:hypothetical protein